MKNGDKLLYSNKIILEFILNILYFPIWWFTAGLLIVIKKNINFIQDQQKSLGVFIWVKNIFRPMYGQTDWQGRLISFFIRIVQIFFRALLLLFWMLAIIIIILLWIIFPFIVFYEIIYQIYPDIALIFSNVQ